AWALGLAGQVGGISRGAFADLIAVPWTGHAGQAVEAVLHHTGDVMASMIEGRWVIKPSHL
ncbi:MAG: hypothetical protein HYZ36_02885, partial [Pedosphaera parvula]|nr:hypothetical protein [Pedosphaera parvula]